MLTLLKRYVICSDSFSRTYSNPQIRWSPLLVLPDVPHPSPLTSPPDLSHVRSSGSFIFSQTGLDSLTYPVASILSSLHRSDLILLSPSPVKSPLRSLPISPYPAPTGTPIRAHFVSEKRPEEDGWQPWIGGTWSKWVRGTVLGYRDFSGREATVSSSICATQHAQLRNDSRELMTHCLICSFTHYPHLALAGVRSLTKTQGPSLVSCLVLVWTIPSRVCVGGVFPLRPFLRWIAKVYYFKRTVLI